MNALPREAVDEVVLAAMRLVGDHYHLAPLRQDWHTPPGDMSGQYLTAQPRDSSQAKAASSTTDSASIFRLTALERVSEPSEAHPMFVPQVVGPPSFC